MINRSMFFWRERSVFYVAGVASILLSLWVYHERSIINPDAICYLLSAEEIGRKGLSAGMHLCGQAKWPFYPFLIHIFAKFSHLSYLSSALVLNGFFSLLTVASFILIVKELGGLQFTLWLALGVILFSHTLNSVREYIIRDHGFWSFYLISMLLLLYYLKKPTFLLAFAVSVSLAIATLFRIEGIVFFLCLPFLSLFYVDHSLKQRLQGILGFYSLLIGMSLLAFIWFIYHPNLTLEKFGRLSEIPYQIQHGWIVTLERYRETRDALAQFVLPSDSRREAGLILSITFLVWYLILILRNLSWIYVSLLFYAWWKKTVSLTKQAKFVIASYLGINIIVTFAFLLERNFLSKRYLVALSLILMLWVPFALHAIILRLSRVPYRIFLVLIVILSFITLLTDMGSKSLDKAYVEEAGLWIDKNIPVQATIYMNDYQLMYYSKHFGDQIFTEFYKQAKEKTEIAQGNFKQYDFIALRLNKKNNSFFSQKKITLDPLQVFSNWRGDKVMIYQTKP